MVRYRSRVDLDRGCKEGAKAAAHIGGLRGAGTWLSPAEVEGDVNIPHAVPKPLHFNEWSAVGLTIWQK